MIHFIIGLGLAFVMALAPQLSAAPLVIVTGGLPDGEDGHTYYANLEALGGTGSYVWTTPQGGINGLQIVNAPAGLPGVPAALTGIPNNGGAATAVGYDVVFQVTDGVDIVSTLFSVTVNPNMGGVGGIAPLSIDNSTLADGEEGVAYTETLNASGGSGIAYAWVLAAGNLPTGLVFDNLTAEISGTPAQSGDFPLLFTLSNPPTLATVSRPFVLHIAPAAGGITITSATTLPFATVGTAYSETLTATGGTGALTWTVVNGALPAGLSLTAATGELSGTPSAGTGGGHAFGIQASDNTHNAVQAFALTVLDAGQVVIMTGTTLTSGVIGSPYTYVLQAVGGSGPITWSVTSGALPTGISLAADGTLSGTPTSVGGYYNFTGEATDGTNSADRNFTLQLLPAGSVVITSSATLPTATENNTYAHTLGAMGGIAAIIWNISAGALPSGLTLNTSNGNITGTPAAGTAGLYTFTAVAADGTNSDDKDFTLVVLPAGTGGGGVTITTTTLPDAEVAQVYSQVLAATGITGAAVWTVSAGTLPSGLTLAATTGTLSGTPAAGSENTYNFTVTVVSLQGTDSQALTLVVNPAGTSGGTGGPGGGKGKKDSGGCALAGSPMPAGGVLVVLVGLLSLLTLAHRRIVA